MEDIQTVHFDCQCHSPEHTLRFVFCTYGDDPEVYTEVYLSDTVWYKRLWRAIKYVFGYKSLFGHFDCTMMKPKDVVKLRELCQEFELYCKNHPDNATAKRMLA